VGIHRALWMNGRPVLPKSEAGKNIPIRNFAFAARTHATKKSCASELKAVCLEKDYEHHPFNCPDPVVDRRATNLAVQRRLGLLSDRRPWPAGSDRVDSRLVQTHLVHQHNIPRIMAQTHKNIHSSRSYFWIGARRAGSPHRCATCRIWSKAR